MVVHIPATNVALAAPQAASLMQRYRVEGTNAPPERVRNFVAKHIEDWSVYDQPAGLVEEYTLATMFVVAYLCRTDDRDSCVSPRGIRATPDGQVRSLTDVQWALHMLCARWRILRMSTEISDYLRDLECVVAKHYKRSSFTSKDHDEQLHDVASILARLWACEYIWWHLIPASRDPGTIPEDTRTTLREWCATQAESCRTAHVRFTRPMLATCVPFGGHERYARAHGGQTAENAKDIIGDLFTHVATTSLSQMVDATDIDICCGILVFYLISRVTTAQRQYSWTATNVVIDADLMSTSAMQRVRCLRAPWIVLVASEWVVVHGMQAWVTRDACTAAYIWFTCFVTSQPDLMVVVNCKPYSLKGLRLPFLTLQ